MCPGRLASSPLSPSLGRVFLLGVRFSDEKQPVQSPHLNHLLSGSLELQAAVPQPRPPRTRHWTAPVGPYARAAEVIHTSYPKAVYPAPSLCFSEKHVKALAYISSLHLPAPPRPSDQPCALCLLGSPGVITVIPVAVLS